MYIGVDTHKRHHVFVALDTLGRRAGAHQSPNTPEGWAQALAWARARAGAGAVCWGVENSGSLGKGFAQFLLARGGRRRCAR
jgi:transposase